MNPANTIPEESTLEEGIPTTKESISIHTSAETDSNGNSHHGEEGEGLKKRNSASKNRLSLVSQKYDINGDGVLDEAQQAMRDLDTTGKGYLSNDKVYDMMKKQMELQKDMFNMKRIVVGLSIFAMVLAVSNLATAWAAAVLAKDTKSNDGYLQDKSSGEILATKNAMDQYTIVVAAPKTDAATGTTTNENNNIRRSRSLGGKKYNVDEDGVLELNKVQKIYDNGVSVNLKKKFGEYGSKQYSIGPGGNEITSPDTPSQKIYWFTAAGSGEKVMFTCDDSVSDDCILTDATSSNCPNVMPDPPQDVVDKATGTVVTVPTPCDKSLEGTQCRYNYICMSYQVGDNCVSDCLWNSDTAICESGGWQIMSAQPQPCMTP